MSGDTDINLVQSAFRYFQCFQIIDTDDKINYLKNPDMWQCGNSNNIHRIIGEHCLKYKQFVVLNKYHDSLHNNR